MIDMADVYVERPMELFCDVDKLTSSEIRSSPTDSGYDGPLCIS